MENLDICFRVAAADAIMCWTISKGPGLPELLCIWIKITPLQPESRLTKCLFSPTEKKKSHQCMKMSRHQCTYKDIEDSTKKEIKTTAIKILLCTIWVRITHIAIRPQYPQSGLLWSRWGVASLGSKNQMICII